MSELFNLISKLETEQRNPNSSDIDICTTSQILKIINEEDKRVALAVEEELPFIEQAVEIIVTSFKNGGRLFYIGAGTSGRLGILDAAECPPTFGTPFEMVQGIIAGGNSAMFKAVEGAEDSKDDGAKAIIEYGINSKDILCGIAASGRTPFVIGAIEKANDLNIPTIFISTISKERIASIGIKANVIIALQVGAEVVTGSTRMKSGTAQKLVLNMLTTTAMIKLGKTYGNVMIDLQMTNQKLKERAKKIVMEICSLSYDEAVLLLEKAEYHVKTALTMHLANVDFENARLLLAENDGFVKKAISL